MPMDFWSPLKLSVEIAAVAGSLVFIFGLFLGKIMANRNFKGKVVIETLILLPFALPPTVVGFLLIILLGRQSPIGHLIVGIFKQPVMFTWWAAVIASAIVAFPIMYQSSKTGFEAIDRDIENAARVDGASEFKLFYLVSIPLSIKAIISGGILSVARILGEFGATIMFAGNIPGKTQTTPLAIYMAIDANNMNIAWLWVGSMIAISFFMLVCVHLMKQ
ncbi:molybdate ABC transporter permease subunit [Bacillus sp. EB600]|uniref:molybdate ABC transporter permease subunit n=1 Tax=Bacillus sp. EB600 TaxID=2806345 RepID=UPI00210A02A1|nr:molybdate ABC transporter permease subunit [Bacillus sp. EB600]MCQ6278566.1 molybdate ABC transporter permease subunit [Bacillus sp. EB600]